MGRRGVVVWRRRPLGECRRQLEPFDGRTLRRRELISGLTDRHIPQPEDDAFIVVRKLGVVVIVRGNRMGLEMSMDSRVRVVGIGLVHMLRHDDRGDRDVGHQDEGGCVPAQQSRHAPTIIVTETTPRQTNP